ncbi:MAG: hypothetical protein ACRCS9_03650 [Hyphomicrobium sp.]
MIRISLSYPYDIGVSFERLRQGLVQGQPISSVKFELAEVEDQLAGLFHPQAIYSQALRGSFHDGNVLYEAIKKLTTDSDPTRLLDFRDVYSVIGALETFEPILKGELRAADAYFVSKKGGFDTIDLIVRAEVLFPADLPDKVPDAVPDIQEAGRCIAFDLGTAAGFHLLRASEAVLLKYWDAVTAGAPRPKNRNLGRYIKRLDEMQAGDAKVRATLRQIKDLHRNSLVHPEDVLTADEAIDLLGIIRSAVSAMLKAIPPPPLVLTSEDDPEGA